MPPWTNEIGIELDHLPESKRKTYDQFGREGLNGSNGVPANAGMPDINDLLAGFHAGRSRGHHHHHHHHHVSYHYAYSLLCNRVGLVVVEMGWVDFD